MSEKMQKLIVALVLPLFFSLGALPVFAQEDAGFEKIKAELAARISGEPLSDCRYTLTPLFDIELKEFFDFLEANFQNKSSNSSLMNIAISRFRDFKENLNHYYAELNPSADAGDGTENFKAASAAYLSCGKIRDEYFSLAKKMMIDHIKSSSAAKKASIMLEKYQAINSRLRDLNMEIAQLYGYFMAFKEKLPGFLQQCLNS